MLSVPLEISSSPPTYLRMAMHWELRSRSIIFSSGRERLHVLLFPTRFPIFFAGWKEQTKSRYMNTTRPLETGYLPPRTLFFASITTSLNEWGQWELTSSNHLPRKYSWIITFFLGPALTLKSPIPRYPLPAN